MKPKPRSTLAPVLLTLLATLGGCGGGDADEPPSAEGLDPSVAGSTKVGGAPVAVAVGEGGAWIADNAGSQVLQLDPADGELVGKPIPVRGGPLQIAAGEGAVWVASGDGTISRIDPESADAEPVGDPVLQPGGIAAGEGSVWVTSSAENVLHRLDAASGEPEDRLEVGEFPADVAVSDGTVWVANINDGTVSRVEASTAEVASPVEVAEQQVLAVSAGEEGVWVAGSNDERVEEVAVTRLDPESGEPEDSEAALETGIPVRLATGEGGVWATLVGPVAPLGPKEPGSVALIDPEGGAQLGEPTKAGAAPSGIATGEGFVWVANAGDGTVTRVDPGG